MSVSWLLLVSGVEVGIEAGNVIGIGVDIGVGDNVVVPAVIVVISAFLGMSVDDGDLPVALLRDMRIMGDDDKR